MKKKFTLRLNLLLFLFSLIFLKGYSQTTLPDYIVTDAIVAPTTIISGVTQVYTYCNIKNDGYGSGPTGSSELRIYVNQDYTLTTGADFGMTYYTEALAAGFSSDVLSISNTITVPAGNYYFVFKVSMPESDDEESDATNNISYVPVTILANMTVETDGNGTVSGLKTSGYAKDETVSLFATPNEGYDFLNWTEGETAISTSQSLEYIASENRTLKANFIKKTFTVSVTSNPTEGGQNSSSTVYDYGTTVTLTAVPNTDYYLVNWTVNGEEKSTGNSYTFTVTNNLSIIANFKKAYTIKLLSSGDGSGTLTGGGLYNENATVSIKATPSDNSTFAGWYNSSTLYSSANEVTFTATQDLTLTARFNYITHLVTVTINNTNYGTAKIGDEYIAQSGDGANFIHNTTCTLTAEPYNDQYTFKNWTESGTVVSTDNLYSFTVTTARGLYANFSITRYTLTLEAGEGGTVTGAGTYNYNTSPTIKATPGTGYYFVKWINIADGSLVSTSATTTALMTTNRSYKAVFAKSSYIITVSSGTGGAGSGGGSYEYGSTCIVTATPASGYTFLNWTESSTVVSTTASYSFTVSAARTIKANFVKTYTISLIAGTGGSVSGQGTFASGATCTVVATPYYGYNFVNWTVNGSSVSTSASYSFTVLANKTLTANFAIQTFAITCESTTGGTVSGQGTFNYGTSVTVTATSNTGYTFTGWSENGTVVSTSASYTFTAYEARTLKAIFTANTFSVSLETTIGGTVSGQGSYDYASTVTISATPDTGYDFVNWTENGVVVATNSSYSFTASENRSLKANFAKKTFTVTTQSSTGGSVTGSGTYNWGDNVTLTAIPTEGYRLVSWTENGTVVSTSSSYTFIAESSRTLTANFEVLTFPVTVEPTSGGVVTGSGTYNWGDNVTLTATPIAGYRFINWTETGVEISTNNVITIQVFSARTLVADFQLTSGVTDLENTSECDIFPIPALDYVFVRSEELNKAEMDQIVAVMYDMAGRIFPIKEISIDGNTLKCMLPEARDGVYFLNLNIQSRKSITKKIVIMKR